MNKKQEKTIKLLEYFSKEYDMPKAPIVEGVSPEEAFFMFTDTGKMPEKISDISRFDRLVYGHRMMALHEKMWREDFGSGMLGLNDFKDEPEEVRELVEKIFSRSAK